MTGKEAPPCLSPFKSRIIKRRAEREIAERVKQAKDLKISEKAFLILAQFGKVKNIRWVWQWYDYLFKKGKLWIGCSTLDGRVKREEIKYKGELVFKWALPEKIEVFKPNKEWLDILDKYYEEALKLTEKEMKEKFGIDKAF